MGLFKACPFFVGSNNVQEFNVTDTIDLVKVQLVKERHIKYEAVHIHNNFIAADVARSLIGDADREHFIVLMLNTKNMIHCIQIVSIGSINSALVHPREVFKVAILANASGIILSHNHPSGDPEPSRHDIDVTNRLKAAGQLLGIEVLDHIILGSDREYSFVQEGRLRIDDSQRSI